MSEHATVSTRKKRRIGYRLSAEPTTGINFGALGCSATGGGAPSGTTFVNNGAQLFTNVHVQLIFWGVQWAGNPNPLANQVIGAVQTLLAGPYMSYLSQYGVRRGSLRGTTFVANGDPPNPFSYVDVGNFVIGQLDADNLPEPDSGWPIAYCVIMPANVAFGGDSRFETVPLPPGTLSRIVGANSNIIWNDYDLGDVDNDPAHYLWVGSSGAAAVQANVDYITTVLSHELVEMCTDPNGGNGIVQVGGTGGASQIGDPCTGIRLREKCQTAVVLVSGRWKVRHPEVVFGKTDFGWSWQNIGGRLRSLQSPIASLNALITSLF